MMLSTAFSQVVQTH